MNRSFPPPAREAFCVLVGAHDAARRACTPNHGVKPGAPVLIEFTIVQGGTDRARRSGRTRPTATGIAPATPACRAAGWPTPRTAARSTRMSRRTACAGRRARHELVHLRRADAMDPNVGTWNCDPFANVTAVIAVFDRLLDTAPFDPGDAAGHAAS